jgi:nicotinamidase-related amidase
MNAALLIIDIQNDYFPGGAMELAGSEEAARNAAKVLQEFRRRGWPVVHVQHVSVRPGAMFFLPNTPGVEIHASVAPGEGETVFQKHYPNCFRETPLLEHLRRHNIRQLVVAGMMTHMCVDTTVRAAFDLGFECVLIHDACATRKLSFGDVTVAAGQVQASYLAALGGAFAKLQSAEDWCTAG